MTCFSRCAVWGTSIAAASTLLVGCEREPPSSGGGRADAASVAAIRAPVEVVRHTFYPRDGSEDYWELVDRETVGADFLLVIHPRIQAPIEGPWLVEFRDPSGAVFSRHPGMRVDVATGNFTFLCRTADFTPGDWGLRLSLEEGGMTAGERVRDYRFRVK